MVSSSYQFRFDINADKIHWYDPHIALILAGKVMIQQPCLIYFIFFIKKKRLQGFGDKLHVQRDTGEVRLARSDVGVSLQVLQRVSFSIDSCVTI